MNRYVYAGVAVVTTTVAAAIVIAVTVTLAPQPTADHADVASGAVTSASPATVDTNVAVEQRPKEQRRVTGEDRDVVGRYSASINVWRFRATGKCYLSIGVDGWESIFVDVTGPVCHEALPVVQFNAQPLSAQ